MRRIILYIVSLSILTIACDSSDPPVAPSTDSGQAPQSPLPEGKPPPDSPIDVLRSSLRECPRHGDTDRFSVNRSCKPKMDIAPMGTMEYPTVWPRMRVASINLREDQQ